MRLFVALPLADRERAALAALVALWQPLDWPVRWVAPGSLHLTLRFLGEAAPDAEPAIRSALDSSAQGAGPIDLVPRAVEFNPSRRRARVLWLALEPVPALELLAHRLERALAGQGMRELDGTFRPHVTLGRLVRDARLPPEAIRVVAGAPVPAPFVADRVVLYQSELDGGPPRYVERHAVSLRA